MNARAIIHRSFTAPNLIGAVLWMLNYGLGDGISNSGDEVFFGYTILSFIGMLLLCLTGMVGHMAMRTKKEHIALLYSWVYLSLIMEQTISPLLGVLRRKETCSAQPEDARDTCEYHVLVNNLLFFSIDVVVGGYMWYCVTGFWWQIRTINRQSQQARQRVSHALVTLPTLSFTASEAEASDSTQEPESCAICLCEYEAGDELKLLPCQHRFHSACIEQWIKKRETSSSCDCPLCKASLIITASS